ncbi:MAG: hypothetical protein ABI461_02840, partial [Polyangiaceae bacterium]
KIVDFGIAKVMTDSEDVMRSYEATGESIHAFSPKYGAPEQFDRKFGATGPWTDVFALALVLVEVVAGKSAMKGDTSQLFIAASNKSERPTLKTLGVEENDAVEKVLLKALAVEPKDRYADAGTFWSALREAAAHGETVLSKRDDQLATAAAGDLAATRVEGQAPTLPANTPPTPAVRATQLFVAALLFGVGGYAAWTVIPHRGFSAPDPVPTDDQPVHQSDLALVPATASAAVAPQNATVASMPGYGRYTNEKYHFVVDVPDDFTRFEDMPDGVGRTYTSAAENARLVVYGGDLVGTLNDMYKDAYEAHEHQLDRWVFPAHTVTSDMFTITGFEKELPFMEKVQVTGGIYARLYVSYPPDAANKRHYEEVLPHARDSFSFTAVSNTVAKPLPPADQLNDNATHYDSRTFDAGHKPVAPGDEGVTFEPIRSNDAGRRDAGR